MFISQLKLAALYLWEDCLWENSSEYLVLNNPCSLLIVSVNEKSHKFSKNNLVIKKSLNRTQADKKGQKTNRKTLLTPRFIKTHHHHQTKKNPPKKPKPKSFWIECSHHNGPLITIICWMLGRLLTSFWELIEITLKVISNQISHPLCRTFFWLCQEGSSSVTLKQSSTNCMSL